MPSFHARQKNLILHFDSVLMFEVGRVATTSFVVRTKTRTMWSEEMFTSGQSASAGLGWAGLGVKRSDALSPGWELRITTTPQTIKQFDAAAAARPTQNIPPPRSAAVSPSPAPPRRAARPHTSGAPAAAAAGVSGVKTISCRAAADRSGRVSSASSPTSTTSTTS